MKVLVVGSGPAAWATCLVLNQKGIRPQVWDIGMEPDHTTRTLKQELKSRNTFTISEKQQRTLYNKNSSPKGEFPKKSLYGSIWFYGMNHPQAPWQTSNSALSPTSGKGGLAAGWGGAVLPIHSIDMLDWPIDRASLSPWFDFIQKSLPITTSSSGASPDRLMFPAPEDTSQNANRLALSTRMQTVQKALDQGKKTDFCISARLAMNTRPERGPACNGCGLCLTGCPQDAIFNFGDAISSLNKAGLVDYKKDRVVQRVSERGTKPIASWTSRDGDTQQEQFDKIYLAAGAVGSSRIVLQSLELFDHSLTLRESQKFALPLFTLSKADKSAPIFEMPSLFREYVSDNHWVHLQVNECGRFTSEQLPTMLPAWLRKELTRHMIVLWGGLHSDLSGSFKLKLLPSAAESYPVLDIQTIMPNAYRQKLISRTISGLWRQLVKDKLWTLPQFAQLAPPGIGFHIGGSLPMRGARQSRTDTDILGRLNDWSQVHVVDSSVLPSIPGTTLALTIMANAARIASSSLD